MPPPPKICPLPDEAVAGEVVLYVNVASRCGDRSPLYQWLVGSAAGGGAKISWNFEKFLVGRAGAVLARFGPRTVPSDPAVLRAIEAALLQ